MAYQFRMNPWRKGREAGRDYARACADYNAAFIAGERGRVKPERPANPYKPSASRRGGAYQWQTGFISGRDEEESHIRRERSAVRKAGR